MAASPLTPDEIGMFVTMGELSDEAFQRCYDFYLHNGEMPYGVAKARDGDPFNWVNDKLVSLYAC